MKRNAFDWRAQAVVGLLALSMAGQSALALINFADVGGNYWANRYIDYLSSRNIITGYPDNTFKPNKAVTRAEFAVMLAKSQGLPTGSGGGQVFNDVPAGHWAAQAIQSVANQGWIAGYPGGRFLPNQNISMAEMYTILAKATHQAQVGEAEATTILNKYQDLASVPAWARAPVASAVKAGINVSELSPSSLFPNVAATRASVAAAIAKLTNPSFRDTAVANQPPQGQMVDVTGTLQATNNPGEWVVVGSDGKQYFVMNPGSTLTGQTWFRVGNQVRLKGNIDTANSNATHTVVNIETIASAQNPANLVSVTGTLMPSASTNGAWLVQGSDGKVYRILNPEGFNTSLLRYGSNVTVTGNLRPDVTLPTAEGTALVASGITAAQTTNTISVTGTLQPTVEAGGWTVVGPNNQKYVLLGAQPNTTNQSWFKSGSQVMVQGTVRNDVPTIYQEGPVLAVSSIQPSPNAIEGQQQVSLYFPNLINIVRDPSLMLGNPVLRVLNGPNLPEKSIAAILQGPSDVERIQGFFVDPEVKKLTLDQLNIDATGRANVVLEAPTNFAFQNSATPNRLSEEITRTLRQFPGISTVNVQIQNPSNSVIWSSQ